MVQDLFIALESGATRTICAIASTSGEILGWGTSGSGSHYAIGSKEAKKNILSAIENALESAKLENTEFNIGCFGMSALDVPSDYKRHYDFITDLGIVKKIVIISDMITAYYAVTAGKSGIVVIAGTGSVAYRVNEKGEKAQSSGREWLISDEGSAYYIAREGIIASLRAYDGRGEKTVLIKMFEDYFNVTNFEDVVYKIYENKPKSIASLAPIVTSAAKENDSVAKDILEKAGDELGLAAVAVADRLHMKNKRITIGCVGGVFKAGELIMEPFRKRVKSEIPDAVIKTQIFNAIKGVIILGTKESGVSITKKLVEKIDRNLQNFEHTDTSASIAS